MSWGSALSGAWNAATGAAREAAQRVASTAQAAYDYLSGLVHRVEDARDAALQRVMDRVAGVAQRAYDAVCEQFGTGQAGRPVTPCPHAGQPVQPVPGPPQPGPGPVPGPPEPPVVEDDYAIVSVAWLDGSDVVTTGDCEQYVNLPRDAAWLAGSGIANIDRLGLSPRFLVTFDKPVAANFQWRIVPEAGGSPAYTATEEGRNARFKAGPLDWAMATTGGDGRAVMADAAQLVAGGGYKFRIEAKDHHNTVVRSGVITTKRLFWYVELPMAGLTSTLTTTAAVDAEFASHHMVLKQLPDLAVAHQENIGTDTDSATLAANVSAAIAADATATAKAPYLLRIAYTDHLAVKNPNRPQRVDGVGVGPGVAAVQIPVSSTGLRAGDGEAARSLWNGLVTGEGWFVSAQYIPDAGGPAVPIAAGSVSGVGAGPNFDAIAVDVAGLPAGTGSIVVNVNVVDRMRGGLAVGGAADICICTRSWWTNSNDAKQACTVVHEMGHKVQMVAAGTGIQPDRVATQYTNRGHVGSHCHNGCAAGQASYNTTANTNASTCAMFGTVNRRTAFCGNCAPAVKKVDIGAGF